MTMGVTLELRSLLVWTLFLIGADARTKRSTDTSVQPDDPSSLTRRILEPPSERIQQRISPEGSLVLEENDGGRQASFIQEGGGIQYKVLDNQENGTYEFGYDTRGARTGARFFRHEEKGTDGRVRGQYGFVDANGDLHVIIYATDALGHRIRTETHKIEGYGHELTKILEKGSSSADVKNQINELLKEKSSSTLSAILETTNKPETTTLGLRRTTRSTRLPTGPEPYFDDAEPSPSTTLQSSTEDSAIPALTNLASIVALMNKVSPRRTASPLRRHPTTPRSFVNPLRFRPVNNFPKQTNSHTLRPIPEAQAVISPSNNEANFRNTVQQPTVAPSFPPPPTFPTTLVPLAKALTTPSGHFVPRVDHFRKNVPEVTASRPSQTPTSTDIPWTLNIPIPQTNSLSQEQFQQIREYLEQILSGSEKKVDATNMKDILNSNIILGSLESLLPGDKDTSGKNLAFFINPNTTSSSSPSNENIVNGDIIDGGIIDGGIINPDALNINIGQNNGKNIIDAGVVDGGIINSGTLGKQFNVNGRSAADEGTIIDGGIIDDTIINGDTVDGGIIDSNTQGIRADGENKNDIKIENLLVLEELLKSENAETFLSLLNLEKVLHSDKVDRATKALILDRILDSGGEAMRKLPNLGEMLQPDNSDNSQLPLFQQNSDATIQFRENLQQFLNSDGDATSQFTTFRDMLKSNGNQALQLVTLQEMLQSAMEGKQAITDFNQDSSATRNPSIIDQLIAFHRPEFPEGIITENIPQQLNANKQKQLEAPQNINANQISSEIFAAQPNFHESNIQNVATNNQINVNSKENNEGGQIQTLRNGAEVQNSPGSPANNIQFAPSLVTTTWKPEFNPSKIQQIPSVADPSVIKAPEVIHYIPSPDLSTGKPDSQQPRPPVTPTPESKQEIPVVGVDLGQESEDTDYPDDSSEEDEEDSVSEGGRKNINLIAPSEHRINSQSNLAIRPVSLSSLSPNRSPVFINSTVYFTTTALPRELGFVDNHPRISRPDLGQGFRPLRPSSIYPSRPRLTKSQAFLASHENGNLGSQDEAQQDETNSNLKMSKNGNDIDISREGLSVNARSHEKTVNLNSKDLSLTTTLAPKVSTLAPVVSTQEPEVSTLATVIPEVTTPSVPLQPLLEAHKSPIETTITEPPLKSRNSPVVTTLPKPPPIIENLPPIHVTTIVPPSFSPLLGPTIPPPRIATVLPFNSKNILSPIPVPVASPNIARPTLHSAGPHHSTNVHPLPSSHFAVVQSSPQISNVQHGPLPSDSLASPLLLHDSKEGLLSPSHPQQAAPHDNPQESPSSSPSGNELSFVPVHTPTHTISAGPHHVFVKQDIRGPPSHSHLTDDVNGDNIAPVLHSGPPLIPSHRPVILPGRAPNNDLRFRNYRLQRRHGRTVSYPNHW